MEDVWREGESRLRRRIIEDVVSGAPDDLRERIAAFLHRHARLGRFEHGGFYLSVRIDEDWMPVDRAVKLLVESPGSLSTWGPDEDEGCP